ncbi:hypothetical protein [Microcystis aeruginosa]|uniref:hypothetical protein n=1 Tax=Microcystis aeruginosa TaxID=1126 RepID=UPI0005F0A89F|nr:hypothetical protein [Microcystis aeruginosa]
MIGDYLVEYLVLLPWGNREVGKWGVGCGVWGVGCGVWGVGCGVWGVGVWGCGGVGVWGVGCGVWGVGRINKTNLLTTDDRRPTTDDRRLK